jgi:hypothetical protein
LKESHCDISTFLQIRYFFDFFTGEPCPSEVDAKCITKAVEYFASIIKHIYIPAFRGAGDIIHGFNQFLGRIFETHVFLDEAHDDKRNVTDEEVRPYALTAGKDCRVSPPTLSLH